CLKEKGPLGEQLSESIPVHSNFIRNKYDVTVVRRLSKLFKSRQVDAIVTVGCGDKMLWGRMAAWHAHTPVIASALHSTGWPDGVGRLNRMLTPITDAFIGVAQAHGQHLVDHEGFPKRKVHVIPNGIDTERFHPNCNDVMSLRSDLGLPLHGPIACIVAALRPEKNHHRFLEAAKVVSEKIPTGHFVIVGDGPMRIELDYYVRENGLKDFVHFLGSRSDIPEILRACDVFVLSSDNEAAPVSILEAMASGLPVVASNVGSIHEMVKNGENGFLVNLEVEEFADRIIGLFDDSEMCERMGHAGREQVVNFGSLETMVRGYEDLLSMLYDQKAGGGDDIATAPGPIMDIDSDLSGDFSSPMGVS
ncbi:MAG: glycosyltransferase, partial [Planctomycetota bacterium]